MEGLKRSRARARWTQPENIMLNSFVRGVSLYATKVAEKERERFTTGPYLHSRRVKPSQAKVTLVSVTAIWADLTPISRHHHQLTVFFFFFFFFKMGKTTLVVVVAVRNDIISHCKLLFPLAQHNTNDIIQAKKCNMRSATIIFSIYLLLFFCFKSRTPGEQKAALALKIIPNSIASMTSPFFFFFAKIVHHQTRATVKNGLSLLWQCSTVLLLLSPSRLFFSFFRNNPLQI